MRIVKKHTGHLNKIVRSDIIKKKNDSWNKRCQYIDQMLGGSRSSQAWGALKSLKNASKNSTTINSIAPQEWVNYFRELLTEDRKEFKRTQRHPAEGVKFDIDMKYVGSGCKVDEIKESTGPWGYKSRIDQMCSLKIEDNA